MAYCENCGTKISDGVCPNCEEELFIFETQIATDCENTYNLSDDFSRKIATQMKQKEERKKEINK